MATAAQRLATGRYGEERAAHWLAGQGMVLLDRNWRCELGEIDLVLRDGAVVVVCEVKTRASGAFGSPVEAVTPAKLARLRRLTILLSPADLPKRGPHFDLSIAVAVLAADEKVPLEAAACYVMLGELTLDGRLRAVPGVLPMSMAARAHGHDHVLVPDCQVDEAAMVPGLTVVGARSLPQVVAVLCNEPVPEAPPVPPLASSSVLRWRGEGRTDELDLADVHGMGDARFALEVAAAGRHHVLLSGPKGAGKTTLAERLPGLLPDLSVEEALEVSAVQSLAGAVGSRCL